MRLTGEDIADKTDGASLIYTTPFVANSLQSLIHSSLGIESLLKRQSLKHNVIDRDKIVVPSNWDSWGKIRIIREGFDMEGVSTAWSIEIQEAPRPGPDAEVPPDATEEHNDGTSAVYIYEQSIHDPRRPLHSGANRTGKPMPVIEVETQDMQAFLTDQLAVLERLKAEDETRDRQMWQNEPDRGRLRASMSTGMGEGAPGERGRVNAHIGPVQFNMGGIQVDAEDMLRKLKVRLSMRYLWCGGLLMVVGTGGQSEPDER